MNTEKLIEGLMENNRGYFALSREEQAFLLENIDQLIVFVGPVIWMKKKSEDGFYEGGIYRLSPEFKERRWFLGLSDGTIYDGPTIIELPDINGEIELEEFELAYWRNKPEGEGWVPAIPKDGDIARGWGSIDPQLWYTNGVLEPSKGYRWTMRKRPASVVCPSCGFFLSEEEL